MCEHRELFTCVSDLFFFVQMDEIVPDLATAALTESRQSSVGLGPRTLVVPLNLSRPTSVVNTDNAAMDLSQFRDEDIMSTDRSRPTSELPVIAQCVTQRNNMDTTSPKVITPVVALPPSTTKTASSDSWHYMYSRQEMTETINECSSSRPLRSRHAPSASAPLRMRRVSPPSRDLTGRGGISSSFPPPRPPSPLAAVVERTPTLTDRLCAQSPGCCECAKTREELITEKRKRQNLENILRREFSERKLSTKARRPMCMHTNVFSSNSRRRLFSI